MFMSKSYFSLSSCVFSSFFLCCYFCLFEYFHRIKIAFINSSFLLHQKHFAVSTGAKKLHELEIFNADFVFGSKNS